MRFFIADIRQQFIAVLDDRRTFIRSDRGHGFDHIRNPVRVGNDHFFRLIAAEIGKLLKHLFRRPEIERRLIVRIRKMLSGHDDSPVDLIARIQKMHVAGCHHRFVKLLAQLYDLTVDCFDIFHRIDVGKLLGFDHVPVISKRLNLQVIIKAHESGDFRVRLSVKQRAVQFSGLAGASENQSFPVLL